MAFAAPRRELGLLQAVAVVVGTVIGSGIFLNLPTVAALVQTPAMAAAIWFLGGAVWIPQVLVLAEMGTAYPVQGGPYCYLQKAGSPFLGFMYTWTAFLTSDTPSLTILALAAMSALKFFSPAFGDPLVARLLGGGLILALATLNLRQVRTLGNIQLVLTVAKLLPLLALAGIGMALLGAGHGASRATQPGLSGGTGLMALAAGISSTLWSYSGFPNILYMAGEVKDPSRSLPRILVGSLLFVMAAYTLIALGTTAIVPFPALAAAKGTFLNPFAYLGLGARLAGGLFAVAAFLAILGVLNACIMAQPRLEYAMARDGLFFQVFGHLHPDFLTPDHSIFIQSGLAILLLALGDLDNLLGYFTISYCLQNALLYGAIFFLRRRADYLPTYRAPAWRLMAGLSILIQGFVGVGAFYAYPAGGMLACLFLILSGLPIYRHYSSRRKARS